MAASRVTDSVGSGLTATCKLWIGGELSRLSDALNELQSASFRFGQPPPGVGLPEEVNNDELNIFDAEEPRHKKLEYAIFLGCRLPVTQVSKLYSDVFAQLFILQPEAFHGTRLGDKLQLSSDANRLRQSVQISDGYFIEGNIDSTGKFERLKYALTELKLEDELFIKFSAG
jgi:hypothetical protein